MERISGNLVDILNETIYPVHVEIDKGKIVAIKKVEKADSSFILPGFIDAHVHVESSMLPPAEFARSAVCHGTVATVSDPHEIGNVLGIEGVKYMLENAATVPFKFYFGAPSCVPATRFETGGATIGPKEIDHLFAREEIKYLSEMMNFPGVIEKDPEVMEKISLAKRWKKRIDGHAPGLRGEKLKAYIAAGIQTDHECVELEEAREKRALGMKILIREGSAAQNFEALFPLLFDEEEACMFCTDDLCPNDLVKGHINVLVKRALNKGCELMRVLRCASWNAIQHYGLEVGLLRSGDPADFIQVENLKDFTPLATFIEGKCVAKRGQAQFPYQVPKVLNHFHTSKKKESDFQVKAQRGKLKVMEAIDGQLLTHQILVDPLIKGDFVLANPTQDVLKIAVVCRYQERPPQVAFIKNFGLKKGAIASSVAHDSHNIIAVAAEEDALVKAVNCLIESQGGMVVVEGEKVESLPFPIAGLMSNQEGHHVAERYAWLDQRAKTLGSKLTAPFMTLSFMALLVIPHLKLSDQGLFDGDQFAFTDLFQKDYISIGY